MWQSLFQKLTTMSTYGNAFIIRHFIKWTRSELRLSSGQPSVSVISFCSALSLLLPLLFRHNLWWDNNMCRGEKYDGWPFIFVRNGGCAPRFVLALLVLAIASWELSSTYYVLLAITAAAVLAYVLLQAEKRGWEIWFGRQGAPRWINLKPL